MYMQRDQANVSQRARASVGNGRVCIMYVLGAEEKICRSKGRDWQRWMERE